MWRETSWGAKQNVVYEFQSTPSVWRETQPNNQRLQPFPISIHSLRVEGDAIIDRETFDAAQFQSTPSVWRETAFLSVVLKIVQFQSTPSVWRETLIPLSTLSPNPISIHSLRVEGDEAQGCSASDIAFQSTPSVWRETVNDKSFRRDIDISIHSLRVEGDLPPFLFFLL